MSVLSSMRRARRRPAPGSTDAAAQEVELAAGVAAEAASTVDSGRPRPASRTASRCHRLRIGGEHVGIIGDVGAVDPARAGL